MTENEIYSDGIGITTLESDKGTVDNIQEDSPISINGIAIPENVVVRGGAGVDHFYSPEAAQEAAEALREQINDEDEIVHLVKNFHQREGQASADDIIGEVTAAGYEKGVGVRFQAETVDEETAQKIDSGYLEISPTVARELGPLNEQMQARTVDSVAGFRDIAVVGRGQTGVDVEVGSNPSIEALSRSITFDTETDTLQLSEARTPTYSGTETSSWADVPKTLENFLSGVSGDTSDVESVDALSESQRQDLAEHSLLGDPNGDGFGEILFFPVVNPNNSNLNRGALEAVRGGRGQQADIPQSAFESAFRVAGQLLNDEFDADVTTSLSEHEEDDTMSFDEAIETVAEEYSLEPEEVKETLESDNGDEDDENTVLLVESD